MRREAAKGLVQETFEKSFDKDRFSRFARELLNRVEDAPFVYKGNLVFDDFKDYVDILERIGKYQDSDGNKLDILIVRLKRSTSLERARTAQRQFVAKYLKGSRGGELKDAALVAFVSPDEEDWRFSFVRMEYKVETTEKGRIRVKEEFTPARRYSFLVGHNENSHTAQSRLLPILEDSDRNPSLSDLEDAFSVEKVTKEFFEKYRELYLEIKEALEPVLKKDKAVREDFADKGIETADFAKKLLGQIVFLYFLQKKGWFGVARNGAWGSGPKNFLRKLCSGEIIKYDNFFNDVLEPLFYEALAVERQADWYNEFKCKIPFLNGGLFDPLNDYDWVHTDILLPNGLFTNNEKTKQGDTGTGILDVFDRYNFTVKEDEPLEKEVAVDPEMLGKVFENLLEVKDRKSKGTYYTPREIVHYMCQESLINYLATELDGDVPRDDIVTLVKHGESALENDVRVLQEGRETGRYYYKLPDSIRTHAKAIDDKLADIKVCDPAVGSGAFLVGMMSEIVRCRQVLTEFIGNAERRSAYDLKRLAIQGSLHGVDIELSSVEIAKLRLWLSLVVDEDNYQQIQPLPNLDYKILQGNSLLETYEGIELIDRQFLIKQDDKTAQRERLTAQLLARQREYIELHQGGKLNPTEKARLDREIRGMKDALSALDQSPSDQRNLQMWGTTEAQAKTERLLALHREFFAAYHKRDKERLHREIDTLTWDLIGTTLKQQKKTTGLEDIRRFQRTNTRPFFLWRLYFADVFRHKGGFDVVIANPPYLESRNSNFDDQLKDALQAAVRTRWGADATMIRRGADLLIYFLELTLHITAANGTIVFLTQNSWLDTEYGHAFQRFLMDRCQVRAVIDSDFKYFDNRTGPNINTVITVFAAGTAGSSAPITFLRFHRDLLPFAGLATSPVPDLPLEVADVHVHSSADPLVREQKWGTLLAMSPGFAVLLDALSRHARRVDEIEGFNITIGQGLNGTKRHEIPIDQLNGVTDLIEAIIPIHTSTDGAPLCLTSTARALLDAAHVTRKGLKAAGFSPDLAYVFPAKRRTPPRLILPRGIGRHYCAWNAVHAYSASGVDVYADDKPGLVEVLLPLWVFLNSSAGWLLREVTGRKNLGGGMLKAEAADLKKLPIVIRLPRAAAQKLFDLGAQRQVKMPLDEIDEPFHRSIDELIFKSLKLNVTQARTVIADLRRTISARQAKARG